MLSGISITCFAASYLVTFALEISRLFFRIPIRLIVMVLLTAAGLVAHTAYLVNQASATASTAAPFSGWYEWCLLAAWVLAAIYLGLAIRRPQASSGLFVLPMVLALIIAAYFAKDVSPFPRDEALKIWGMIHGILLLIGTIVVILGFSAGIMYLVQAYRLKNKLPPRQGFKLPSLEWLQKLNSRALLTSTSLLGLGLLAGVVMNYIQHQKSGADPLPWTDPVVWSSAVLFFWLVAASIFEIAYKPARQGRKVAYLTVASFIILAMVMVLVLFGSSEHARQDVPSAASPTASTETTASNGESDCANSHPVAVAFLPLEGVL